MIEKKLETTTTYKSNKIIPYVETNKRVTVYCLRLDLLETYQYWHLSSAKH
jgi:hypothetical protein